MKLDLDRILELAGLKERKVSDIDLMSKSELTTLKESLETKIQYSFILSEDRANAKMELQKVEKALELCEHLKKVDGRWAIVSKTTGKPLRYYKGEGKPSDEWVEKQEKSIQYFKNMNETIMLEGNRLVKRIENNSGWEAKVYNNSEYDEYFVKFFQDGTSLGDDSTYFTDDLEDAISTAKYELAKRGDLVESVEESKEENPMDRFHKSSHDNLSDEQIEKNLSHTKDVMSKISKDHYSYKDHEKQKEKYEAELKKRKSKETVKESEDSKIETIVTKDEASVKDTADRLGITQDENTKVTVPSSVMSQIDKRIKELKDSAEEFDKEEFNIHYSNKLRAVKDLEFIKEKLQMGNLVGYKEALQFYFGIASHISELFPAGLVKFLIDSKEYAKFKPMDTTVYPQIAKSSPEPDK